MFPDDPHYPTTFNDEPASCPAWFFTNPQVLGGRGPQVDQNHAMPEVPGKLLRDPVQDQLVVDGIWEIGCDVDPDGEPYGSPEVGYAANKLLWLAAFFDAEPTTRAVDCVQADPAGNTRSGVVQFGEPRFVETLTGGTAYMRLTVPDGLLVVEAPAS